MEKSIYQQIVENISDGVLDESFSIDEEIEAWAPLRFAPGALDGMHMYHMERRKLDADGTKQMARALKSVASGNYLEADTLFFEWTKEYRAICVIDDIQKYVMSHADKFGVDKVLDAALYLVLYSTHIECVKVGLELLEIISNPTEKRKEIIRRVGLYDEFTIFAVWNMQKWDNGNQEIFDLAKKVHSWGRIHTVKHLEPETDEIQRWLLMEGTVNYVENAYSSLVCWKKSGAEEILFSQPTQEEYKAISTLVEGLLDEGPVPGISELDNPERILQRFLSISQNYVLTADDYEKILTVQDWAEENKAVAVAATCGEILHSSGCEAAVKKAVKEGQALKLAEKLNIPFRDDLLECMRNDFDNHYYNCRYLMDDDTYTEPVLDLFRHKLPLSEMKKDPVDDLGLGEEYKDYNVLQFILQELGRKLLVGIDLVIVGLESPVTRNRSMALRVLQEWVQNSKLPMVRLSPRLYSKVNELRERENNDENAKRITQLLEGLTSFPEDDEKESEEED